VGIECGNEEVEREQMIADSIFLIYFDARIQNMKPVAHIKPSPDVPGHGAQLPLPKLGLTTALLPFSV
jgi:hypothetical protein